MILEAAVHEFGEKGFAGATTAGIARRARTHQPLVHHHFGSKERLFRVVIDLLFAELRAEVLAPEGGDARSLIRRLVLFNARRPELARIWVIESARRGRLLAYIVQHHIEPLAEYVRPRIERSIAEGEIPRADVRLLFYAALGLTNFPFLVSEQIRESAGSSPLSADFGGRYANLVLDLLFAR